MELFPITCSWVISNTHRPAWHFIFFKIYLFFCGEGNSNPLQYSCLENLRERGACGTTVHGITESDTTDNWAIFWLCWIFIAMHGFSLVVASGGYSSLRRRGFSLSGFSCCRTQALGTQASLVALCGLSSCGSRALECWLSCSEECGIFPDQRLNRCPLCQGRILTAGPPGKPWHFFILISLYPSASQCCQHIYYQVGGGNDGVCKLPPKWPQWIGNHSESDVCKIKAAPWSPGMMDGSWLVLCVCVFGGGVSFNGSLMQFCHLEEYGCLW